MLFRIWYHYQQRQCWEEVEAPNRDAAVGWFNRFIVTKKRPGLRIVRIDEDVTAGGPKAQSSESPPPVEEPPDDINDADWWKQGHP